jgi:hypothetical protein
MLQRQGRILKGGMKIRLAGVAGVAGLGEEAKVGQAVPPDQVQLFLKEFGVTIFFERGIEKHQSQKTELERNDQNEKARFSHRAGYSEKKEL